MTVRSSRLVAILAILFLTFTGSTGEAQTKKSTKKSTKKAPAKAPAKKAPAPAEPAAVGNTFEERVASLVNSPIARNAVASIQIVELETGRVVAERNPTQAITPA
jgi:hypothetical protein